MLFWNLPQSSLNSQYFLQLYQKTQDNDPYLSFHDFVNKIVSYYRMAKKGILQNCTVYHFILICTLWLAYSLTRNLSISFCLCLHLGPVWKMWQWFGTRVLKGWSRCYFLTFLNILRLTKVHPKEGWKSQWVNLRSEWSKISSWITCLLEVNSMK